MIAFQTFDWLLNMLSYGPYDMAPMIWIVSYGPYSMDHTVYMTATQFTLSNNAEKNNL